jgi:hypothetical protein
VLGEPLRPLPGSFNDALDKDPKGVDSSVQSSVWRSGADIGILITNVSDEQRQFRVLLAGETYGFAGDVALAEDTGTARELIGVHTGTVDVTVTIAPRSLRFFEVVKVESFPAEVLEERAGYFRMLRTEVLRMPSGSSVARAYSRIIESAGANAAFIQFDLTNFRATTITVTVTLEDSNDRATWRSIDRLTVSAARPYNFLAENVAGAWMRIVLEVAGTAVQYAVVEAVTLQRKTL